MLKYARPPIKRKDTRALSCPPAPVGVIEGSRADVSFVVGMMIDKFDYHLPLYRRHRQHRRLDDAGIRVSRPWLTQLMQSSVALLEPVYDAQLDSIRASRVKAMNVLHQQLRTQALQHTALSQAQPSTVISKLFKIAVQVRQCKNKIVLHLPSVCPVNHLLHTLTERLYLSTPAKILNSS